MEECYNCYKCYCQEDSNWWVPDVREMVRDAGRYEVAVMEMVPDATDPTFSAWKGLGTPPALVAAFLVLFVAVCAFLAWTGQEEDDREEEEGRKKLQSGLTFYKVFLVFQLAAMAVNLALFLTPLLLWFAQGKLVRLAALLLEAVQSSASTAPLLRTYVAAKFALFMADFALLTVQQQGDGGGDSGPRGRSLHLFHQGLRPVHAWVSLRYFPGGIGARVTPALVGDALLDAAANAYWALERRHANLYPGALEAAAGIVCAAEVAAHLLTLRRLSAVVNLPGDPEERPTSPYLLAWMVLYCSFSALCLCTILAGMAYRWRFWRKSASGDARVCSKKKRE